MKKISIIVLVLITVFICGFCFFCSAQKVLRPSNKIIRGETGTMDVKNYGVYIADLHLMDCCEINELSIYCLGDTCYSVYSYKGKIILKPLIPDNKIMGYMDTVPLIFGGNETIRPLYQTDSMYISGYHGSYNLFYNTPFYFDVIHDMDSLFIKPL